MIRLTIFVIALLLAIGFPSLQQARVQARRVACASNLRQWGLALQMYRDEHRDYLPTEGTYLKRGLEKPNTWYNELPPYLDVPPYMDVERNGDQVHEFVGAHIWICPAKSISELHKSLSGKNQFHYAMNRVLDGTGKEDGGVVTPGFPDEGEKPLPARRFAGKYRRTVYMFDVYPNDPHQYPSGVGAFHGGSANVLFLAGNVNHFPAKRFVVDGDWKRRQIVWDDPDLYWGYLPKKKKRNVP